MTVFVLKAHLILLTPNLGFSTLFDTDSIAEILLVKECLCNIQQEY